jgi:hypothetical protein
MAVCSDGGAAEIGDGAAIVKERQRRPLCEALHYFSNLAHRSLTSRLGNKTLAAWSLLRRGAAAELVEEVQKEDQVRGTLSTV